MQLLGVKRIAYYPITNGLVERFHRQLKAALKCHPNPSNWVSALPLTLLGFRTILKADLQCSAAEHSTTLRLLGQFFDSPREHTLDPAEYVTKLDLPWRCTTSYGPVAVESERHHVAQKH